MKTDTFTCTHERRRFARGRAGASHLHPEANTAGRAPTAGLAPLLLSGETVGEVGCEGNAKHFVLEGLDHQHNPEHEADEPKQRVEAETEQEEMREAQQKMNGMKPAKNDDRLGRVKLHKGPLIDQKKNDAGYPAKHITQQTGDVLAHAFGNSRGRRRNRLRGRGLVRAALRTEIRRANVLTTGFAKRHEKTSGRLRCAGA